mmetsp:Transcript_13275/g.55746  ORF Transcript_13275/g.55746 Transcript_13275/m.55746 type:complete len:351 (+) Transcript_13275:161-1213(+)
MGDWQKGKRGGGGGGGGGGKRGRWHKPSSSSAAIPYGTRGVVVTCEQGKERAACRDVARALDEIYEAKFPSSANAGDGESGDAGDPPSTADPGGSKTDPSDALAAELRQLKEEKSESQRFEYLNLDFKACAFVRMNKEDAGKCAPSELVHALLEKVRDGERVKKNGGDPGFVPRSRHVMRLVPADDVCFAGMDEIKKAAKALIDARFTAFEANLNDSEPSKTPADVSSDAPSETKKKKTFAVAFASRANSSLKRAEVIDAVADLVPKGEWSVDLSTPDLTIAVEVIKGTCCLSVLREYYGMLKYNWRMLGLSDEERAAERARGTTTDRNTEKTTTNGGADDGKRAGENDA